nr:myelin transcription factor 1-like protein [Coffea arabica]
MERRISGGTDDTNKATPPTIIDGISAYVVEGDTEDTNDSDNNVDDDLDKEKEDNSSNENDFGPPFVEAEEEDQIEEHDDPEDFDNYGGFKENDDPEDFDNNENNGNLIRILTWMDPNDE